MEDRVMRRANYMNKERHNRKNRHILVCCLAVLVVLFTGYLLSVPAITMERETVCSLEEHVHTEACFTEVPVLTCGLEESEEHTHSEACYETVLELTCGLTEHVHTDECYAPAEETVVEPEKLSMPGEESLDPEAVLDETDEETGILYPAQRFEEQTADLHVLVEAPEGAFPEGTNMVVTPVYDQQILDTIAGAVDDAEGNVRRTVLAVDISFYDAEGNELQPLVPIRVSITGDAIAQAEKNDLVHLDGEGNASLLEGTEAPTEDTIAFDAGGFSIYGIVGTVIIETPAGELVFEGDGYTVKITYKEECEIPLGTELNVRELVEGTEEYNEYLMRTEAALRGDESEVFSNEDTIEKISRMLSGFDELKRTKIFDIVLVYNGEEIEPNPDYPLSVEMTYSTDISESEDELNAKIVHFAAEGTEVISDVELQENEDGSVTLTYEQNSFSRTAASLLGSYGNGGWIGGNGNTLVFRYGYATINGEPVFEIQYNGAALNDPTLVATPGSWPGDPGYPHNPQTGVYFDGTCDPGTTMMELIEACNTSALATSASCSGFKVIMGTTYTVNSATGAHSLQTLGQLHRDLRSTVGDSFALGGTSEEYWYSPFKIFRIERGLDANGNGWHDPLVYNQGHLPLDILAGVIIDNKSANSDIRESNGSDDSKTGAIYPIAVTSDGSLAPGATSASGLTMIFNGCYVTDSSYNGTPVGTGVKIINLGSLEMFSHGNTPTGAASSYIENMAVAVEQISGKTRLKTAADPFGSAHHNTIGVALSYGQSIGKWYLHLNQAMSRVPIWLRSVKSWKSGDIVMDSGWQIQGQLKSPVEDAGSYYDINKLNLVNQNNTSTVMGLEFYVGTNDTPYPVIRFFVGSVFNTRTGQWYKTLYDAVTPGQADVTGGATQVADGDTLVFYGNTLETNQININYNLTIRGAFDTETINNTEIARAARPDYTCQLSGASVNWISIASGKTVTFGGNATTNSNGTAGTVSSGVPGMLIIDGGNTASYDIVNWGTTNLKSDVSITNASVAGVFQSGEEHLYAGALFSGNTVDHLLVSDGTPAGNHYITLETRTPNGGNTITNSLGAASTQYNGRDVVVAGTTDNIGSSLSATYLSQFTLTDKDPDYDYVYTVNGGPNGERVLELKQKASITVRVNKVDDGGSTLSGAEFTLYIVESGVETPYTLGNETNPHVTDSNGKTQMTLREGSYVLKETGVPSGYNGASDLSFTVTNNNGVLSLSGTGFALVQGTTDTYEVTVVNVRKTVPVTLKKVDESNTPISGVTFGLDSTSTTHTTGNNGTVSLGTFTYGSSHTLHETWSNILYVPLSGDISISVDQSTGVLTATPESSTDTVDVSFDAADGYTITVTNHPETVKVAIRKVGDDTNGSALAGATFTLTPTGGGSTITMRPGNVPGTYGPAELQAGTYTITETVPPTGYQAAGNGTLTVTIDPTKSASVSGTDYSISGPDQDGVYTVTVMDVRKTVPVTLRKIDSSGSALGGVTFDFDNQPIVTGDGNNGTVLGEVSLGSLPYGSTHTLDETWSDPQYQALSGVIGFSVDNATGQVTITSDPDHCAAVTGDATNGYVITVTNMPSSLPVTIRKVDQAGNLLTGATLTLKEGSTDVMQLSESAAITNSGEVTLPVNRLQVNTVYTIAETQAPAGYLALNGSISFQIVEDAGAQYGYSLKDGSGNAWDPNSPLKYEIQLISGTKTLILKLTNVTGVELPQTGGPGTFLYTLGGFALILASALMLGFSLRRRERRFGKGL